MKKKIDQLGLHMLFKFIVIRISLLHPCTIIYHLLTESEVITGKCQTERLRGQHQGRGLRFPCNDRTDEVNKLFIICPNFPYPLGHAKGHLRSCSLSRNEPGVAIETIRHSFLENETFFFCLINVKIWGKFNNLSFNSRAIDRAKNNFHNARSLQDNRAYLAANQSVITIAAI